MGRCTKDKRVSSTDLLCFAVLLLAREKIDLSLFLAISVNRFPLTNNFLVSLLLKLSAVQTIDKFGRKFTIEKRKR